MLKKIVNYIKEKLVNVTYIILTIILFCSIVFTLFFAIVSVKHLYSLDRQFNYEGFIYFIETIKPFLYSLAVSSGLITSFLGLMKYEINYDSSILNKQRFDLEIEENKKLEYRAFLDLFNSRLENFITSNVREEPVNKKIISKSDYIKKEIESTLIKNRYKNDDFIDYILKSYFEVFNKIYKYRFDRTKQNERSKYNDDKLFNINVLKQIDNLNLELFSLLSHYTNNENLLISKIITYTYYFDFIIKSINDYKLSDEYEKHNIEVISKRLKKVVYIIRNDFEVELQEYLNHNN